MAPRKPAVKPPADPTIPPASPFAPAAVAPKKDPKKPLILRDTAGNEVAQKDYFYSKTGEDAAPSYFNEMCGMPVDREDMIEVFDQIFNPELQFLFYKQTKAEVYIVIVPLKYAATVGSANDSIDGDCQKHAMSFINEGGVNIETLKLKLKAMKKTIRIEDK